MSRNRNHLKRIVDPGKRRYGFTLVELLVVVSIIALLLAILLPSLKNAREQAKSVQCKSNLRGIGQAFTMYAEKYDGVWPSPVDHLNSQNRWPVPFHKGGIITAKYATFDSAGKQITSADKSIFLCPSERAPRIVPWDGGGTEHPTDRVELGGSYAMTEEVHRTADGRLVRGSTSEPPHLNKIDNCRRAAEVFAVMDHFRPLSESKDPGWRFNRGAQQSPPGSGTFRAQGGAYWLGWYNATGDVPDYKNEYVLKTRIIGNPHLDRGNGLCIDTHVESFDPKKVAYNQISWERWKPSDGQEKPFGGGF